MSNPTELYLIRHGLAGERGTYANDDERPLTEAGVRKTQRVAKRLYELAIRFDLIQTSPLVRARQTAEILQAAKLSKNLEESPHLAPAGDLNAWVSWFETWRQQGGKQLAIVGHEPDLGNWTEQLVWGNIQHHVVVKKAGVIGLLLPEQGSPIGNSELFWLTSPRLFL